MHGQRNIKNINQSLTTGGQILKKFRILFRIEKTDRNYCVSTTCCNILLNRTKYYYVNGTNFLYPNKVTILPVPYFSLFFLTTTSSNHTHTPVAVSSVS